MTTQKDLRTRASLARLAAREAATPDQITILQAVSPWTVAYLLSRRRRGIHVLGTRWEEYLQ